MVWVVVKASSIYGVAKVIKYYGIPWIAVSHWCTSNSRLGILLPDRTQPKVIMITYLQHTGLELLGSSLSQKRMEFPAQRRTHYRRAVPRMAGPFLPP